MPIWPPDLPERPTKSFTQRNPDLFSQFKTEIGPPKRRRVTSSGTAMLSTVWELTGVQVDSIEEFYFTTLSGGSISFGMAHPRHGRWAPAVWMSAPSISAPKGDDTWDVSIELEMAVS